MAGRTSLAEVRKQIKSGQTAPIYLLIGDDEVEKANLAATFAEVVEEELRAFNVERLYGDEVAPGAVLDAARTLPVMASRRIVIVLRAERLLTPKRESEAAARELELLEKYVTAPQPHATLVLVAQAVDERRRLTKLLLAHASVVDCGGLDGTIDAERWVRTKVAGAGVAIDPDALRLLAHRAGPDIGRLRGDVERVLLFAAGQKKITAADVLAVVGPATAQDNWAVTTAIEQGQAGVALKELALALDAGAVPYMVLGQLGWFVRTRFPASSVPGAVASLFRTDLDLKTSGGDPRVLLERLVVELCEVFRGRAERSRGWTPKPTPGEPSRGW